MVTLAVTNLHLRHVNGVKPKPSFLSLQRCRQWICWVLGVEIYHSPRMMGWPVIWGALQSTTVLLTTQEKSTNHTGIMEALGCLSHRMNSSNANAHLGLSFKVIRQRTPFQTNGAISQGQSVSPLRCVVCLSVTQRCLTRTVLRHEHTTYATPFHSYSEESDKE